MTQDENSKPNDLDKHSRIAATEYQSNKEFYEKLTEKIGLIIEECLTRRQLKVHSVQKRTKDIESFAKKASKQSENDPNLPKYTTPLKEITDISGVRIITYFLDTLKKVDDLLRNEFDVIETSDKGRTLIEEKRFGYQSVHYIVRIKGDRAKLPEYERYKDAVSEVQVRTILQHTWAEIEHDIQYKSSKIIPDEINRRFGALAGMLEIADREFQAIQVANLELLDRIKAKVSTDDLEDIEITPSALKLFLDKKLGQDSRYAEYSYDLTVRVLKKLGFNELKQINTAIDRYDQDDLGRIAGDFHRQGQLTRFEYLLLAALGDNFVERHPWNKLSWYTSKMNAILDKFKQNDIPVGTYDPEKDINSEGSYTTHV